MLHILLNPVSILLMNMTKAWWWWSWPKHDDDDLSHWSFLKYFNFSVSFQSPTADREARLLWLDFFVFLQVYLYLYLHFCIVFVFGLFPKAAFSRPLLDHPLWRGRGLTWVENPFLYKQDLPCIWPNIIWEYQKGQNLSWSAYWWSPLQRETEAFLEWKINLFIHTIFFSVFLNTGFSLLGL